MKDDRFNQDEDVTREIGTDPSIANLSARLDRLLSDPSHLDQAQPLSLVGHSIGNYRVSRIVGRGAFGVVYHAHDVQLGRDVALKLPRPEVLVDTERLSRFESEARTAAALDHPTIVPLLEANLDGPTPYIASAFCTGPDLGAWLADRREPVSPNEAVDFVAQLAEGVQYAHEKGVLHRDLKPANVLLEPISDQAGTDRLGEYKPRLTDFGLSKLVEANLQDTRSSLMVGTPLYMAPEQLTHGSANVTAVADIYSLGVLLFELLTLQTPIEGDSYVEVIDNLRHQSPLRLRSVDSNLPVDLQTICDRCLVRDPKERYASAGELREELGRFLLGQPLKAKPWSWLYYLHHWMSKPKRITQAGWFTYYFQGLSCLWMFLSFLGDVALGAMPEGVAQGVVRDMVLIALTGNVPIALLGWRVGRGSRWAFWPAAILTTSMLVFVVYTFTAESVVFAELYPTLHSRVSVYTGLTIGAAIQSGLFIIAIPAWLRQRQQAQPLP